MTEFLFGRESWIQNDEEESEKRSDDEIRQNEKTVDPLRRDQQFVIADLQLQLVREMTLGRHCMA